MWTETLTKLAIIRNYEMASLISVPQYHSAINRSSSDTLTVYKKRKKHLQYIENQIDRVRLTLGKELAIKQSKNLVILKAKFNYSWQGLVTRYFFQAPFVYAHITYSNGTKAKFRAIVPAFESGVIINQNVQSNHDLDQFFAGKPLKNQVQSIRFESKNSWGFDPTIEIKLSEVEFVKKDF